MIINESLLVGKNIKNAMGSLRAYLRAVYYLFRWEVT